MPRPTKGEKTPGSGRKKGTPNRNSLSVQEILDKRGINLVESILDDLEEMVDPNDRAHVKLKLADYVFPRRKAVTEDGKPEDEKPPTTIKIVWNASNATPDTTVEYDHPPASAAPSLPTEGDS